MKTRLSFLISTLLGLALISSSCNKTGESYPGMGSISYDGIDYDVRSAAVFSTELRGITNGTVYSHSMVMGNPSGTTIFEFCIYSAGAVLAPGSYTFGLDESYPEDEKERYIGKLVKPRLVINRQEITGDPAVEGMVTVDSSSGGYCNFSGQVTLTSGKVIEISYRGEI